VFASGINQPTGLAFDGQGNLYVADRSDQILKYNSSGQGTVFASTGSTGPGPEGLAFDGAGNLYVANYWNNAIYKFNPSGNGGIWASTGGGYNNPFGLAYANGTLYASCNVNEIEAFDANGNGSFFASTQNGPWFMAFQPVPEPSVLGLLAFGLFGITLLRRHQR
jgi:outer membrane protein assembly factor BamB